MNVYATGNLLKIINDNYLAVCGIVLNTHTHTQFKRGARARI
jgi:hypothetical protein